MSKIPIEKLVPDAKESIISKGGQPKKPAERPLAPWEKKLLIKNASATMSGATSPMDKDQRAKTVNTPSYQKPFQSKIKRDSLKNSTRLKKYDKLDSKYSTLDIKEDGHKI